MVQKQSSPPTLSLIHLSTPCTPKKKPDWKEKTASTSKKKLVCWPCPGQQSISRSCGTTTARRFVLSLSERETWCYAEFRSQTGSTSYPHLGKAHSSSAERSRTTPII